MEYNSFYTLNDEAKINKWTLRYEIDFIFRMLENKIPKISKDVRTPKQKFESYINGLQKRNNFDDINFNSLITVCMEIARYLEKPTIDWNLMKKQINSLIQDLENERIKQ